MVKEPIVIDLIRGDYLGLYKGYDSLQHGRRQIYIRPIWGIGSGFRKTKIPYKLDKDKDIIKDDTQLNQVMFLVPNSNIPDLDMDTTLWKKKLMGEQKKLAADLQKENKSLEKELGAVKKELRDLRQDDSKEDKGGGGGQTQLICPENHVNSVTEWKRHDGLCPDCGRSNSEVYRGG